MASARRAVNNLGDVQLALNDIFTQLENLTSKPQNYNQRIVTGIPDPKSDLDAVNYETLKSYVATQVQTAIDNLTKTSKGTMANELGTLPTIKLRTIVPFADEVYNLGSSVLRWLTGYFKNLYLDSGTASRPLKTDASKNLISGKIDLSSPSTDIQNTLGVANGGTGQSSLTANAVLLGNGTSGIQTQAGVSGGLSITTGSASPGTSTVTIQYKDWTGTNQSVTVVTGVTGTFLTAASITSNNFTNGVRTT